MTVDFCLTVNNSYQSVDFCHCRPSLGSCSRSRPDTQRSHFTVLASVFRVSSFFLFPQSPQSRRFALISITRSFPPLSLLFRHLAGLCFTAYRVAFLHPFEPCARGRDESKCRILSWSRARVAVPDLARRPSAIYPRYLEHLRVHSDHYLGVIVGCAASYALGDRRASALACPAGGKRCREKRIE